MNIDYLKENSIKLSNLSESIEVADTDEIVNAVIERKQYASLAYQICEVSPIHGPTGATFALAYIGGKFKLLRGEVTVESDALEDTGFTLEAMQDLQSTYGKSANAFIGRAFGGVSNKNENIKLVQKMSTFAGSTTDLFLSDPKNAETTMFEVQQKVAALVLLINSDSFKSLDSFAVVPMSIGASMLAISNRLPENNKEKGLFLGANSRTKFYLNPDVTSKEIFVGINSDVPGQSSMIISPYHHAIKTAVNPETGENAVFNFNRYAITESRLSQLEKMLYKFEVTDSQPNVPPVAVIAGGDVVTTIGTAVVLDGSSSTDQETGLLTFKWTLTNKPATSDAVITYGTLSIDEMIPDVSGQYIVQLVVGDGTDYSPAESITIDVV